MELLTILVIILIPALLGSLQDPYPTQTLKLREHPLGWICTVHVTVASFGDTTSSDIADRFLASNREMIVPTLSTMLNRTISIASVISFFEPCTVSVLLDSNVNGFSYANSKLRNPRYIFANEYKSRGWRHSVIIVLLFSCRMKYTLWSYVFPHRLFYHSFVCGPDDSFPNHAFVSNPLQRFWRIYDPTHNIHDRQLLLTLKRWIPKPEYGWDDFGTNMEINVCFASRWRRLSERKFCKVKQFAVYHYQNFINFTAVARTRGVNYGEIITRTKFFLIEELLSIQTVGSMSNRIIYCDQNLNSVKIRLVNLSLPFSSGRWGLVVSVLILCTVTITFGKSDFSGSSQEWKVTIAVTGICNTVFELIACLLEKDVGKENCVKALVGLVVICIGNTFKNYLTIDLVYPRAQGTIQNFTELLDLDLSLFEGMPSSGISVNKSVWLQETNVDMEIDKGKREKYVGEANRWLKFGVGKAEMFLTKASDKNAISNFGHYHSQLLFLNGLMEKNYPFLCHFVKRPFAPEFDNVYFFNSKAEEFKWWTGKFLDHGLFEFWKRLEAHTLYVLELRKWLIIRFNRSNSSSPTNQSLDLNNFVGQVHLYVFYMIVLILTAFCVLVFVLECAGQSAKQLLFLVLTKFKHFSLEFVWTVARCLFLMGRFMSRHYQNRMKDRMV
jgi:hypothetical protein